LFHFFFLIKTLTEIDSSSRHRHLIPTHPSLTHRPLIHTGRQKGIEFTAHGFGGGVQDGSNLAQHWKVAAV
jgi:hypothetical protein